MRSYPTLTALINVDEVSSSRRLRCLDLAFIFEEIVNHSHFILTIKLHLNEYRTGETSKWKDVTAEKLLTKIFNGAEEWNNEIDNEADIYFKDYSSWYSKVVGFMTPGKKTININNKFHDHMSEDKRLSNMTHEWFHTLGFRHGGSDFRKSFSYLANKAILETYSFLRQTNGLPGPRIRWEKKCRRVWYHWFGLKKKCFYKRVKSTT